MNKPEILYRGVKITYDMLKDFKFYDTTLYPPNPYQIDENGRKVVADGNEYGLYMTTNKNMVLGAYAKVSPFDGTVIDKDITIGINPKEDIRIPAVGIVYSINTKNIDIRKPFIKPSLQGHYNNGFEGEEWITDKINKNDYQIIDIKIGKDILHDSLTIDTLDIVKAEQKVKEEMEKRKQHLLHLVSYLKKFEPNKRYLFKQDDIEVFKQLFGDNGSLYIDVSKLKLSSASSWIKYLFNIYFNKNATDLKTLKYIETLNKRIKNYDTVTDVIKFLKEDIVTNEQKKQKFLIKNNQASTLNFDNKNMMYQNILNTIFTKLKEEENKNIQIVEQFFNIKIELEGKEIDQLFQEKEFILNKIDNGFLEGLIDSKTSRELKSTISKIYNEKINNLKENIETDNYNVNRGVK